MSSCREYINKLTSNVTAQNELERLHNKFFNKIKESKLFRAHTDKDDVQRYYLPKVGTKDYIDAKKLINRLNYQDQIPKVGTSFTRTSQKEYVFVNVKNYLPIILDSIKSVEERETSLGIDEFGDSVVMYQNTTVPASTASPEVIKQVKEFLSRIGMTVEQIKKATPIQGYVDFLEGVIGIAEGKENIALTEEGVHAGIELMKINNPSLYKEMFNKIGQYKIFDLVLKSYQDDVQYQLKDGKPNIPKLKDEAIAKLVVEFIIKNNNNQETLVSDFMANSDQVSISLNWWQKVIEWIKAKLKVANFNPFEEASKEIFDNKGLTKEDISKEQLYFQKAESVNPLADELLELFDKQKETYKLNKQTDEKGNSYYEATNPETGNVVKPDRTTEFAKRENKRKFGTRDIEETDEFKQMAALGTDAHEDGESIINAALDENGFLKSLEDIQLNFTPRSRPVVYNNLVKFLLGDKNKIGWLYQFPIGTKFALEKQLYNPKAGKTGRASTLDLIVIRPDGHITIYDWKFMGTDLKKNTDQIIFKRRQHAFQLQDYKNSLKNAYVSQLSDPSMVTKIDAFTIPFNVRYATSLKTKKLFVDKITYPDIEVTLNEGATFQNDEQSTFFLPSTPWGQSSGNTEVDTLINNLQTYYDEVYKKIVDPQDQFKKRESLNRLSEAMRHLQIRLHFGRIANEADVFRKDLVETVKKFNNVEFEKFTNDELRDQIKELNKLLKDAQVFADIDDTFINVYGEEDLSEKDAATLKKLKQISSDINESKLKLYSILGKYVDHIAINLDVNNVLDINTEVSWLTEHFTNPTKMQQGMLKLFGVINETNRKADEVKVLQQVNNFTRLYEAVRLKYGNVLDQIADSSTLKLKAKITQEFWDDLRKAKENKDKKFILNNIDVEKYNELAKEEIERRVEYISKMGFDKKTLAKKIDNIKKSLDIKLNSFDGYNNKDVQRLINMTLLEEKHYTKEYEKIKNDADLLALYEFVEKLNLKADKLGYLQQTGFRRFLPFIEGTIAERLLRAGNDFLKEARNVVKDEFIIQYNDGNTYSKKRNPETGKIQQAIPRLFTRSEANNNKYSRDLLKIIPLYIRALQQYETSQKLSDVYMAMFTIENAKGHHEVDKQTGNVVMTGDEADVFAGNQKNASLLWENIEDSLYGVKTTEDWLDQAVFKLAKKTDEEKEQLAASGKKIVSGLNKFTRHLLLGLKPLIAIPNYIGAEMQTFINSGDWYKWKEFQTMKSKLITNAFTKEEGPIFKGLLELFVHLNEDSTLAVRRKTAWKQSPVKWLSTWSMADLLMVPMSMGDKLIQLQNAGAWIENTMVLDGKLVNIREHVRKELRKEKYSTGELNKSLEKEFDQRVKELQETKGLQKIAIINNEGYLEIPGIDADEIGRYRARVLESARKITGMLSDDDKAAYKRKAVLSSFMMFKNWIAPHLITRWQGLDYDSLQHQWDYGRTRLLMKTVMSYGLKTFGNMKHIVGGTSEGLKLLDEMLAQKREEYKKATGKELNISKEEFYDLVRDRMKNQIKEISLLLVLAMFLLAAKATHPEDDDDKARIARSNYLIKLMSKVSDELYFYYSPTSAESITRGSFFPALSAVGKAVDALGHTYIEVTGVKVHDWQVDWRNQDVIDKNNTIKYWINLVPGNGIIQESLPIIDPELAKDLGYKSTSQARPMR